MTTRRWLHSLLWALGALVCVVLLMRDDWAAVHLRALSIGMVVFLVNATLVWKAREPLWKLGWWNLIFFVQIWFLLFFTNAIGIGKVQVPRALFALFSLAPLWRSLLIGVVRTPLKNVWKNLAVTGVMLLSLFVVGETICMFLAYPVGPARSLSSQLWYARHWKPINSMGYRDIEYSVGDPRSKVVVIGDSYAAGQGIENAEWRFPDLLRSKLPATHTLVNLSQPGATTFSEWENFRAFPDSADVMILSYLTNDIEHAAAAAGHVFAPRDMDQYPEAVRFVVHNSYLINLLYSITPYTTDFGYGKFLEEMNADPKVWDLHFAELQRFVDYAQQRNIPLLVVLWPDLVDPSRSQAHLAKVTSHLQSRQVDVLDLTPVANGVPASERVVNGNDGHPGEKMHEAVVAPVWAWLKDK